MAVFYGILEQPADMLRQWWLAAACEEAAVLYDISRCVRCVRKKCQLILTKSTLNHGFKKAVFLSLEKLTEVFGENLLDKKEMENDFKGLSGLSPVKPFECVGTAEELKYALSLCSEKLIKEGKQLPCLLKLFRESFDTDKILKENVLNEFNREHNIPYEFLKDINEMYEYVRGEK